MRPTLDDEEPMRTTRARTIAATAALTAVVLVTGCGMDDPIDADQTQRDATGRIEQGGDVGVFALQLGDCFDDPTVPATPTTDPAADGTAPPAELSADAPLDTAVDGTTLVDQVPAIPCDTPHDFEVYGLFDVVDEAEFPGETVVVAQAETGCLQRFADYVGAAYAAAGPHAVSYLYPTGETWATGDRSVLCLVHGPEKRVGSVRGVAT
jgi:hypothetical protein